MLGAMANADNRGLILVLTLAALLLEGCPETTRAPEVGDACERIGQQCRLPEGPVGVCNDTGRTDCAEPPCLACVSQH
jgi:hypothetical protein